MNVKYCTKRENCRLFLGSKPTKQYLAGVFTINDRQRPVINKRYC